MKLFSVLLGCLFCVLCAQAEMLTGRVTDTSGKPVSGANLTLEHHVEGPARGTSTGADGSFQLDIPENWSGQLRVSHIAFQTETLRIEKKQEILNLELRRSLLTGKPVTVTSSRADRNRAVTYENISQEEIRERSQGQDLSRLLEGTPNLVCMSYSGTSIGYNDIRLRGFDQKRVEVLVNGIPLNDPEDHSVYWVDLPDMASSLKDIQVQRGTGGGSFGGSNFGGSVNMLTDLNDRPGGSSQISLGSFATRKISLGLSTGLQKGRWQMDARWSQLETAGYRDATDVEMWGYYLAARAFFNWGNLRLNHYSGEETSHFAWDGINETVLFGEMGIEQDRTQNNDAVYDNSVDFFRQPHTELVVSTTLPDNSQLDATLFQVSGRGYYESFKPDSDPFVYGLDLDVDGVDLVNRRWIHKDQLGLILENKRALGKGELHLGLNGYLFSGEHFGEVIMTETTPVTQPQRYYLHETDKSKLGAHARLNWPLAARLSVEAGLGVQMLSYQLEQKSRGNFTASMLNRFTDDHVFLNPGLGLSWQYSRKLSLHASLSQSHREPSRGEYWNAWEGPDDLGVTPMFSSVKTLPDGSQEWSDPIIDPEQMLDLEVGMQWRSEKHLLGVNLYWLDMQDEIVNFGGVDEESPVKGNAPRSHHAGLELSGQWQTLDWLNMGGNAAFSENKIDELTVHDVYYGSDWSTSTVSRDFSGNSIALSPDLVANFWLEFDLPYGVRLRPSLQHVGEQFLDNSNDDGFVALHPDLVEPGYLDDSGSAHFSKTIDAYTLLALDARLSLRELFNQDLELHLHVENLLDTEYETGGYWNDWVESNADWLYEPQRALYPGAKRNWMLSVNWSF